MQMHKQRQRTVWGTGMNPTGLYTHMFVERGEKEIYPNDNRNPYKEEIKLPPPHPHKRKNINYFSHSKDPYFLSEGSTRFMYVYYEEIKRELNRILI
jgi:hypothetical protein